MSIGKKISGGFCAVILLTMLLGLWAIHAMNSGADVAETIAADRLPRFACWTNMQNDLLESAYYAKDYFDGCEEGALNSAWGYLREYAANLQKLKGINAKLYYANTAKALEKTEKDLGEYERLTRADQELYIRSEKLVAEMMAAANEALHGFAALVSAMSATLENFVDSGDAKSARQYARNIAAANSIYGRIGGLYQDLLAAERNNDLEGFAKIRAQLGRLAEDAREVDKQLVRPECHKIFAESMEKYNKFASLAQSVASTLGEFLERGKARHAHFQNMYKDTVAMVDLTTENSDKYAHAAAADLSRSTTIVGALLAIVLILGIIVAFIITRLIVRPLAATQHFAQDVASGNLERELDVHTSDETGKLADALRSMVAALRDNISAAHEKSVQAQKATDDARAAMTRAEEAARRAESARQEGMHAAANKLEGVVEIISSASTQLSAQIEQSDHGASESAQRLQEAATAMNQMNATVQEVARNAGSASEASSETRHKAVSGQQVVHEVVQSIGEVHETSLKLKEDMIQLNERAQDINRIMGVISDIADQTNLLALNAAIEAARAGEAGRGFAVVADEVRKLAEKTMTSTLDVSNAIHAIQESTSKSMAAVDTAVERIGHATNLAHESGSALEEIVATVEATSDQVQAIAAASEQQSAASEEINRSITEVNDMSRLVAEAMSEASKAVSDLANQAHNLTTLVAEMKTE